MDFKILRTLSLVRLNKNSYQAKGLFRYAQGHGHSRRSTGKIDLVRSITSTFINGIQNNLANLFSILSTSLMQEFICDGFDVKVNVKGQKTKLILSRAYLLN